MKSSVRYHDDLFSCQALHTAHANSARISKYFFQPRPNTSIKIILFLFFSSNSLYSLRSGDSVPRSFHKFPRFFTFGLVSALCVPKNVLRGFKHRVIPLKHTCRGTYPLLEDLSTARSVVRNNMGVPKHGATRP